MHGSMLLSSLSHGICLSQFYPCCSSLKRRTLIRKIPHGCRSLLFTFPAPPSIYKLIEQEHGHDIQDSDSEMEEEASGHCCNQLYSDEEKMCSKILKRIRSCQKMPKEHDPCWAGSEMTSHFLHLLQCLVIWGFFTGHLTKTETNNIH